jgi:hypothetical protein
MSQRRPMHEPIGPASATGAGGDLANDFGDDSFREGLEILLASIDAEARLSSER